MVTLRILQVRQGTHPIGQGVPPGCAVGEQRSRKAGYFRGESQSDPWECGKHFDTQFWTPGGAGDEDDVMVRS